MLQTAQQWEQFGQSFLYDIVSKTTCRGFKSYCPCKAWMAQTLCLSHFLLYSFIVRGLLIQIIMSEMSINFVYGCIYFQTCRLLHHQKSIIFSISLILLPICFCSFYHSNQSFHIIVASPYVTFINTNTRRLWIYCMQ